MHAQRYGTSAPAEPAEIASLRTTVTGVVEKPELERIDGGDDDAAESMRAPAAARPFSRTPASSTRRHSRGRRSSPATASQGPALIEEHASTTVVLPGDSVEVDAVGNLIMTISGARA